MTNQPYSQPPPVPKNNNSSKFGYIGFRLSILGLFFALLCCFGGLYSYPGVLIMWILGFILSLSGFVLSLVGAFKPLRQFAIAGLVISSVGLLASLLFIGFAGTNRVSTSGTSITEDITGEVRKKTETTTNFFTNSTLVLEEISYTDTSGVTTVKETVTRDGVSI